MTGSMTLSSNWPFSTPKDFGDDGVDFARHDRRARLTLRQLHFGEAAARAARHEAEVVRHLDEHERRRLHGRRDIGERVRVVRRIDEVFCRLVMLARDLAELLRNKRDVLRLGVEARAGGRAAHVDDMDAFTRLLDAADAAADSGRIRAHFLAERDGHGILQVRAAHLEDIFELDGLLVELISKARQRGDELLRLAVDADLDARRERVVRRLRHVRVVVRGDEVVAAFRLAEEFERAVREHFVHVHVDGRARAALDRIDGELVEQLAADDFVGRLDERHADAARQAARFHVRKRSGLLHHRDGLDEIGIDRLARDVEIVDGAHRLHAVVDILRHFEFTDEIMFLAHLPAPFLSPGLRPAENSLQKNTKRAARTPDPIVSAFSARFSFS